MTFTGFWQLDLPVANVLPTEAPVLSDGLPNRERILVAAAEALHLAPVEGAEEAVPLPALVRTALHGVLQAHPAGVGRVAGGTAGGPQWASDDDPADDQGFSLVEILDQTAEGGDH